MSYHYWCELLILTALAVVNRVMMWISPSLYSNAAPRHRCSAESMREYLVFFNMSIIGALSRDGDSTQVGRQTVWKQELPTGGRFTSAITGLLVQVDLHCATLSLSLSSQLACNQAGCREKERKSSQQSDSWASSQNSGLINFLVASSAMQPGEMVNISKNSVH